MHTQNIQASKSDKRISRLVLFLIFPLSMSVAYCGTFFTIRSLRAHGNQWTPEAAGIALAAFTIILALLGGSYVSIRKKRVNRDA